MPFEQLLVPRDFSETSDAAVEHALDLARRTGARLHLLHVEIVQPDPFTGYVKTFAETDRAQIEARLATAPDGSPLDVPGGVTLAVERDLAAGARVAAYARSAGIDCIVLGTHGRRGVRRFLLGNVTGEVARIAPCSVLAVRAREPRLDSGPVVVGVDFSAVSRHALRTGVFFARLFGSRLRVVHVVPVSVYPAFFDASELVGSLPAAYSEQARAHLRELVRAEVPADDVDVSRHVEVGRAHEVLQRYASGAGLVVVGARGMGGVERFLLGSTAERTLRVVKSPVLIARPPEDAEDASE